MFLSRPKLFPLCRRWCAWMRAVDSVEGAHIPLDRDRLLELLSDRQKEEVRLAGDEDGWTTLLLLLRSREEVAEDVRRLLDRAGVPVRDEAVLP